MEDVRLPTPEKEMGTDDPRRLILDMQNYKLQKALDEATECQEIIEAVESSGGLEIVMHVSFREFVSDTWVGWHEERDSARYTSRLPSLNAAVQQLAQHLRDNPPNRFEPELGRLYVLLEDREIEVNEEMFQRLNLAQLVRAQDS